MLKYFESIRTQIEQMAGDERYLTNSLFWELENELFYEDENPQELKDAEDFAEVRELVLEYLETRDRPVVEVEILSWHTGILRDLCAHFHHRWEDILMEKLMLELIPTTGQQQSQRGEHRYIALDVACEKSGSDPTETYTLLIEALVIANTLYHAPKRTIHNSYEFGRFQLRMSGAADSFMQKRVADERTKVALLQNIECLRQIQVACHTIAKYQCGGELLIWSELGMLAEGFAAALQGLFECSSNDEMLWLFDKYIECIIPHQISEGYLNPLRHSPVHRKIARGIMQAVSCLYGYQMGTSDTFAIRDTIVKEHLCEQLHTQANARLVKAKTDDRVIPFPQRA